MALHLDSRPLGTVLLVQCNGRIVAGQEVFTLHAYVGDALLKYRDIILQMDQVAFLDSSGLGALVRLVTKARSKGGDIKLCGVQPQTRKALEVTTLQSLFETYDSIADAIMAAYLGSLYSKNQMEGAEFRILCVYDASDVRTLLTEILCRAGYNTLPTASVDDAAILLKATKAKLVILGSNLQAVHGKPTRNVLEEIDPTVSLLVLDERFAEKDPGEAAAKLLEDVKSIRAHKATLGMAG
ncbi:MAG TPA: anti-sigma factor antagonist [Terriglobales bacterium]|nr:anti-sigma factor antagonist [Terriglobales bacterium]